MAGEPHLHPGVRVVLANDRLVEHRVVVTGGVSGGQPGRDAEVAQHQRFGGGELLAVAGLDVEEEPVDGIAAGGHRRQLQRVVVVLLQVAGQRHDRVEQVGRAVDRSLGEEPGPGRQGAGVEVSRVALRRIGCVLARAEDVGGQVR